VGSEMCIRDRSEGHAKMARLFETEMEGAKAPVDPEKD